VELAGQLELSAPPWTEQTFLGKTSRDPFAYSDGRIKEVWRNLFEKHPDRFINGFDLFTESAYKFESIKMRVDYWRNLLGQVNQEAAERIAYRNVEDILAHRVNLMTRTATVATASASHTTTAVTQTTGVSAALTQTTTTPETETKTATSTQLVSGVFTIEVAAIIGVVLVVVATGVFYLRRRGK
jgi:hypothetical protein